ncbi:MAG TPA: hypothetical protein VGO24_04235 [Solirubrobacterales bacterium]|nr:hypothetical protein [Solirubrobacterales bacterium]
MAPWKLPLLVIVIAVPTVAAFYAGGPGVGVAVGALVAVAIVLVAVRARPRGPIGEAPSSVSRRRLLVIVACPVEDPAVIARIAAEARGKDVDAEVLVLAPVQIGFLDRWASDLEGARRQAQQNLVITVASLAKAGVAAEARVGDEDLVQAVEDALQSYPATEVILVTADGGDEPTAASAVAELQSRLRAPLLHLRVSDPAAR